jgi:hypothetical protein
MVLLATIDLCSQMRGQATAVVNGKDGAILSVGIGIAVRDYDDPNRRGIVPIFSPGASLPCESTLGCLRVSEDGGRAIDLELCIGNGADSDACQRIRTTVDLGPYPANSAPLELAFRIEKSLLLRVTGPAAQEIHALWFSDGHLEAWLSERRDQGWSDHDLIALFRTLVETPEAITDLSRANRKAFEILVEGCRARKLLGRRLLENWLDLADDSQDPATVQLVCSVVEDIASAESQARAAKSEGALDRWAEAAVGLAELDKQWSRHLRWAERHAETLKAIARLQTEIAELGRLMGPIESSKRSPEDLKQGLIKLRSRYLDLFVRHLEESERILQSLVEGRAARLRDWHEQTSEGERSARDQRAHRRLKNLMELLYGDTPRVQQRINELWDVYEDIRDSRASEVPT